MLRHLLSIVFGAAVIFAAVAVPADAADVNEEKVRVCNSCHGPDGVPPSITVAFSF
jgi:cytochrome c553